MNQYEFIRTAHRVYGRNISELSRMTGHSRNTVKKALRGEMCGYKERHQQPFPVLGEYLEFIDAWLQGDKEQPRKQRHTARRVYNRLVVECGYRGGESTVRRYVRMAKIMLGIDAPKAFVPSDPESGVEAEVDWGSAKAIIAGKAVRLKFFCMRSKYSGKHFVRFYPCERQQVFYDAHIQAFDFFGGVFPVLIYDRRLRFRRCYRGGIESNRSHSGSSRRITILRLASAILTAVMKKVELKDWSVLPVATIWFRSQRQKAWMS